MLEKLLVNNNEGVWRTHNYHMERTLNFWMSDCQSPFLTLYCGEKKVLKRATMKAMSTSDSQVLV